MKKKAKNIVKATDFMYTAEDLDENLRECGVDIKRKKFVEELDERIKRNFSIDNANNMVYSGINNSRKIHGV